MELVHTTLERRVKVMCQIIMDLYGNTCDANLLRRLVICREEETALCVVGEKENISHNVTRKRANKHCLTIKYG